MLQEFTEFAPRVRREQVENKVEEKISEWGLPGVEIVGAPWGSIFRILRGSQLPYTSKYVFDEFITKLYMFYYIFIYKIPDQPPWRPVCYKVHST